MTTAESWTQDEAITTRLDGLIDRSLRPRVGGDLICILCGSDEGRIEQEGDRLDPTRPVDHVAREPGTPRRRTTFGEIWRRPCRRCGGRLFVEEIASTVLHVETVEWADAGPRLGRPPTWLREQRKRDAEEAEAEARR